jgi:protein TonB
MRSSGTREIDAAAVRIVQLAAPYSPLPENITESVDILHITRTWRFETGFGVE